MKTSRRKGGRGGGGVEWGDEDTAKQNLSLKWLLKNLFDAEQKIDFLFNELTLAIITLINK